MSGTVSATLEVDLYRVGLLEDLSAAYQCVRRGWFRRAWTRVRRIPRRTNLRRSYLNGWLAEDSGATRNCGHGWTRRRALRSLERQPVVQ